MAEIDTHLGKDLKKFGAFDFNACYNCGTCTAVCSLSTETDSFPREMIRYSVLGMDNDIKRSLKPWLCYYCGECTTHCPQEANPGELMMSLRRYLTSVYDWTGLSGVLYRSLIATVLAMLFVAATVTGIGFYNSFSQEWLLHTGHLFEMTAIAAVFAVVLLPNIIRMWYFTIIKAGIKVPIKRYITSLGDLLVHMFTQKRALDCDDNRFRWFEHLVLVLGYLTLLFTTVFLNWFSTESVAVIVLGYVVSIVIFIVTAHFIYDRFRKNKEMSKKSQPSDWFFVIWLFLMGVTAFAVRIFIDTDLLAGNIWLYMLHIIVLAQWALIIVPFGKWTHFLYRSFAMYFEALKAA